MKHDFTKIKESISKTINWTKNHPYCAYIMCVTIIMVFIYIVGLKIQNDHPSIVIIGIAFMIIGVIVPSAYKFLTIIRISSEQARKLEILGYLFLFSALVWNYIFKDIMMDDFISDYSYISIKLDYIFEYIRYLVDDVGGTQPNIINYSELVRGDAVEAQIACTKLILAILEITSTILIAIGRFDDLRQKKKDNMSK